MSQFIIQSVLYYFASFKNSNKQLIRLDKFRRVCSNESIHRSIHCLKRKTWNVVMV
ncbi:hypothetical protein PDJAM_G00122150 [Pangasius djambal]|uniref:Uncharacterized protein n=1 Tax=Pangasius djambal TaxID=1691987 RepID=A0ACC5ZA78_9TELE|nr:hypothetical protein [Pangasius djambal]